MKLYLLGVLTPVVIVGVIVLGVRLQRWKHRMSETFGERFAAMADAEDAKADQWERELYGNGYSGWAGYDCGRQADGLYRGVALALIKSHRATAKSIRAQLPGQPGYGEQTYDFEHADERQREWQAWYDDFHARNNLDPLAERLAEPNPVAQ